jgi:four helix bundle protein
MGVRHHRELEVWQLCNQARGRFLELAARSAVRHDFTFRDQTLDAASSACRNTAEGFWRFGHAEFAHFVSIAKASLGELMDSTDEALQKRYIDEREYKELNDLLAHALAAATSLHTHLSTTPTPRRSADRHRTRDDRR